MINLINDSIVQPCKNHLVLTMIFSGFVLISLASIFGSQLNSFLWDGVSDTLINIASAILGGGVFAAIIKSSQFSEIFMNNLSDVVYSPSKAFSDEEVLRRWTLLTEALLKPTLPSNYTVVANEIKKQFFEGELKYHFEGLERRYDIKISDDGDSANIKQVAQTKVVVAPGNEAVVIKQQFSTVSEVTLRDVFINNKKINIDECLSQDASDKSIYNFEIKVSDYDLIDNGSGDKYINMTRIYEFDLNIREDPNMILNLNRYVKGLVVKVKVQGPGTFDLKGIGLSLRNQASPVVCTEGWTWYTLAGEENLLLPGQGYTLTIVGNGNKLQQNEGA